VHFVLGLLLSIVPRAVAADPFAGVSVATGPAAPDQSGARRFFTDNFGFRKEIMLQYGRVDRAGARQSAGFEALKKLSSETRTWASFDFQGRLVRRDRAPASLNDMEGMKRPGWFFEYHNAYADFYNPLDPLLSDERRAAMLGRVNLRVGRFYVPFGLNTQTDTHGTVLQLSNERNFGFERDWYTGVWGSATNSLDYGVYYLAGSGYDLKYKGQRGLTAGRASLSNRFLSEYGLEGGASWLQGERLSPEGERVVTRRGGVDGRWRRPAPGGTASWTTELSDGRDASAAVFTQLHQLEYLRASRRWGAAAQFRRFPGESSALVEATWYLRNDVASSNLHWIKLNVERQTERRAGALDTILTLQYYRYW
jgi:hypothetical protein